MSKMFFRPIKKGFTDLSYYYVLIAAVVACLFMSFFTYVKPLYAYGFAIPCMLFLGVHQGRGKRFKSRKYFILSGIMVAWFLLLQLKRSAEQVELDNIGLFISVYLFAFPLASVLREDEEKKALKIFAGAYLAAAAILSAEGWLLIFDRLPESLVEHIYWDGDRLVLYWHPNIAGCLLMIGAVFCVTFLMHEKSLLPRIGLSVILVMIIVVMALTSCRTALILVAGYFGSIIFYILVQRDRKWFVPAVLAALIILVAFYSGGRFLYEANSDRLIEKYTQMYLEQVAANAQTASTDETELPLGEATESEQDEIYAEAVQTDITAEETIRGEIVDEEVYFEEGDYAKVADTEVQEETLPIAIDPDSGEVHLIIESPQGDIEQDFGIFNSRTYMWVAAKFAIRENPSILWWGVYNPGEYVSAYNFFPIAHMHNAWIECLMGMGLVGFLIALLFTLMTAWNCLIILMRHYQDIWKRSVAWLVLCLLAAAFLEPYLFYTTVDYNLVDVIFFVCAGYLAYWQEEDNHQIMETIRNSFL